MLPAHSGIEDIAVDTVVDYVNAVLGDPAVVYGMAFDHVGVGDDGSAIFDPTQLLFNFSLDQMSRIDQISQLS